MESVRNNIKIFSDPNLIADPKWNEFKNIISKQKNKNESNVGLDDFKVISDTIANNKTEIKQ